MRLPPARSILPGCRRYPRRKARSPRLDECRRSSPAIVTFCRFTECVAVCPVECFHADEERTYIDPEVCIDCSACIPACPVRAIYEVIDIPDDQRRWIEINAERARILPVVFDKQDPLPTAAARRTELGF